MTYCLSVAHWGLQGILNPIYCENHIPVNLNLFRWFLFRFMHTATCCLITKFMFSDAILETMHLYNTTLFAGNRNNILRLLVFNNGPLK